MKIVLCLSAMLIACATAASMHGLDNHLKDLLNPHIVGGNDTTIGKYPYQANLRKTVDNKLEHWCGGVIYSNCVIITAAHCLENTQPSDWHVTAGSTYRIGTGGVTVSVKEFFINENYNTTIYDNDIGIVVLSRPLPLNGRTMQSIKLAHFDPNVGEMATITGWGVLSFLGTNPEILQVANVPIISRKDCIEDYKGNITITDGKMCAGYRGIGGIDACNGDSGGPMVVKDRLVGIVADGTGCADPKFPGIYTRIPFYVPWILEKVIEIKCPYVKL